MVSARAGCSGPHRTARYAAAAGQELYGDPKKGYVVASNHLVKQRARELMYDQGLGLEDVVTKHAELLHADKAISTKFGIEMVPDRAVQVRALELAYDILGVCGKQLDAQQGAEVKFTVDEKGVEKLNGILQELKGLELRPEVIEAEYE